MDKRVSVGLLLIFSISIILISGYVVLKHKYFWGGDEAISYLCATGNEENFASVALRTEQAELNSTYWKELLSITEPYSFEKIANDLIFSDLHPPLYFWLLHVYILQFGVSLGAGVVLNMALHILSLFVLFGITRKLEYSPLASGVICLFWASSPAALGVGFYARQYELLGLICLLYAWVFLYWKNKPTTLNILLITLLASLGFLTHYSFIYLSGGYWVYAVMNTKSIGYRHIIAYTTTFVVALLCLYLLHPGFTDQFILQQQRTQHFEVKELFARAGKIVLSVCNFFIPVILLFKSFLLSLTTKLLLSITLMISGAVLLLAWIKRAYLKQYFQEFFKRKQKLPFPLFMAIWILTITAIPYLLFVTPFHSMGGQYLVCLYPFMSILLFELVKKYLSRQLLITGLLLTGSCIAIGAFVSKQSTLRAFAAEIGEADYIVCDGADRRNLGRIIPYLNNNQIIRIQTPVDTAALSSRIGRKMVLISINEPQQFNTVLPNQEYFDFGDLGGFIVILSY